MCDRLAPFSWLQSLATVAQLATAGLLGWYSIETARLRRNADNQLELARSQARAALACFLFPAMTTVETLKEGELFVEAPRSHAYAGPKYYVRALNPSDALAVGIHAAVYDSGADKLYLNSKGAQFLPKDKSLVIEFGDDAEWDVWEGRRELASGLDLGRDELDALVVSKSESYVMAFYRDVAGHLLATKRPFRCGPDGLFTHGQPRRIVV